jgi:SWI/SNF-related matrix-associated actin-dependent regulator of chromatin subfamily A-like protein 1
LSPSNVASSPPSPEVLAQAARQVAEAYPGLYAHQRAGVAFLLSRRRSILADDMGLGKSRTAVVALREAAPTGPYLVVCPAGVKLTWRNEIRLVEHDADILVVHSAADWQPNHRWTVVNYDLLGKLEPHLLAQPWSGIVVDEAHYIKNDSARTRHVQRLLTTDTGLKQPGADPEAVYLLTGTPMSNRPRDLFNLLRAVRHPLGHSFFSYAKRYCAAFDNGYGLDSSGASNLEELAQIVSGVMLRRTKDEALDLPPKVRSWQAVSIGGKKVGQLEARALDYLDANPARSGPTWITFLGMLNRARHELAIAKVSATIEAVRERVEAEEKVVVFTGYQAVVDALVETFGSSCVSITGAHSIDARQRAAAALQTDPSIRVLVGNLQAAGTGITLTAATHVVFNDLDWVPGNHWQAEDRIYRIGQTRPAFATYLYAEGTLDDFVAALLEAKARNIGVLEDEAAQSASLVHAMVEAAVTGERPRLEGVRTSPAAAHTGRSVGLVEETLDLLARARRGLGAIEGPQERVIRIASKSKPGEFNEVTIIDGVARCSCTGFAYRGNCSHAQRVAADLAASDSERGVE